MNRCILVVDSLHQGYFFSCLTKSIKKEMSLYYTLFWIVLNFLWFEYKTEDIIHKDLMLKYLN